jgi:copper chaperone CopZ
MNTVINIEGMHCDHCRQSVMQALMAIPGVEKAEVSLETRKAVITHDGSVDPGKFVKAVQAQGYTALQE